MKRKFCFALIILLLCFQMQMMAQENIVQLKIREMIERKDEHLFDTLKSNYKKIPGEEAGIFIENAILIAREKKDKQSEAGMYGILGVTEREMGNIDRAMENLDHAFIIYKELDDYQGMIKTLVSLSITMKKAGDYSTALGYLTEAQTLGFEIADSLSICRIYNNTGSVYFDMNSYDKALEYYIKSAEILNNSGTSMELASNLNNIANVYNMMGDHRESISWYLKAAAMFEKAGNFNFQANAIYNCASAYTEVEDYEKGISLSREAHVLWKKAGNDNAMAYSLNQIGKIYSKTDQMDSALVYYLKSLAVREKEGNLSGTAYILQGLGGLYLDLQQYDSASYYLMKGMDIAKQINSGQLLAYTYDKLFQLNQEQKKHAEALEFHILYKAMNDSIYNEQKSRIIAEMKTKYETDLKEMENVNLKKELLLIRKRNNAFVINMIILTTLVISLVFVFYFVINSKNQKKILLEQKNRILRQERQMAEEKAHNLQDMIEIKDKELISHMMLLARKNELLNNLAQRIKNSPKNGTLHNGKVFKEVVAELKNGLDDQVWKDFDIHFQNIHNSFFDHITKDFPTLTPREKRLCAFLRLNMSTKDIANLTYLTTKSVDIARSRLRNKLGLERQKNLQAFLARY